MLGLYRDKGMYVYSYVCVCLCMMVMIVLGTVVLARILLLLPHLMFVFNVCIHRSCASPECSRQNTIGQFTDVLYTNLPCNFNFVI